METIEVKETFEKATTQELFASIFSLGEAWDRSIISTLYGLEQLGAVLDNAVQVHGPKCVATALLYGTNDGPAYVSSALGELRPMYAAEDIMAGVSNVIHLIGLRSDILLAMLDDAVKRTPTVIDAPPSLVNLLLALQELMGFYNSRIWGLESSIRGGHVDDISQSDVGKRTEEIRTLNLRRNRVKTLVTLMYDKLEPYRINKGGK